MLPKQEFKKFARDRLALGMAIGLALTCLIVSALLVLWLQPSDVQIPIRYNGFGLELGRTQGSLASDQWYERISFVVFAVFMSAACLWLSVKMHESYKVLAKFLLGSSLLLLIILALVGFFVNRTITL
ncbi:hypothetical protein JNJ66_05975 [Candidatus Saccharibacteria bacterium]|nr:hypothetical protein [Candidatus Saccharibacteria bacterium]